MGRGNAMGGKTRSRSQASKNNLSQATANQTVDLALPPHAAGNRERKLRRVALLIETSREYGRGLLRGVTQYLAEHGPWSLSIEPSALDSPVPGWFKHWQGDGILARIDSPQLAKAIAQCNVPVIDLRNSIPGLGFPVVGTDSLAVAKLVHQHFRERMITNLACCGFIKGERPGTEPRQQLRDDFYAVAGPASYMYPPNDFRPRKPLAEADHIRMLSEWLMALPKPVGILAVSDLRGLQILDACRRCGIAVPDEVAVVGADNDELMCNLCTPPLSSVALDLERVGYSAAQLLEQMMAGKAPMKSHMHLLPPLGLVTRQSSDTMAVTDREVAAAAQWIRQHALSPITVRDVIRRSNLSRRSLEQRFLKLAGRTLNEEIVRAKLTHVQRLLIESKLSLTSIAEKVGVSSGSYLGVMFQRQFGVTCTEFRRRHRGTEIGGPDEVISADVR
jgi:LacI family transcriptional regulator